MVQEAEFTRVINEDSGNWIATSHPETRAFVPVSLSVCGRSRRRAENRSWSSQLSERAEAPMDDGRRVGAGRNGFTWSERSGDMECRRSDRYGTELTKVVSGIGEAVGLVAGRCSEHCARRRHVRLGPERFLSIGRRGGLGVLVGPVACVTKAPRRVDRGTAPSLPWSTIMRLSGHSRWVGPC